MKFYTPPEVADILRLTVETLSNWRQRRYGPAFVKFGRKVLYSEEALQQFVQKATEESPT